MEIKRTIPKGAMGSRDFKTKKIFVGGIPTTVNEGDFSLVLLQLSFASIRFVINCKGGYVFVVNGQTSSGTSFHNLERSGNTRSCGTIPQVVHVALDLLPLTQSKQLMISWPRVTDWSWQELR